MTDKHTQATADAGNMEKDPADWVTGDEPMTGAQRSYLKTLSEEAHVDFDENLTKADASRRIDELQHKTGRGLERKKEGGADEVDANRDDNGSANPGSAGGAAAGDEATVSIGPD